MKLIEPSVELWKENDFYEHLAKCARVCYASENTKGLKELANSLIYRGHTSMYRHCSCYYIIKFDNMDKGQKLSLINTLKPYLEHNPFISYFRNAFIYISTNANYMLDNPELDVILSKYAVSAEEFIKICPIPELIRLTFCVTTQISTSRELNRVSPNNIAEQSTRYVNFKNKGGIGICKPHFWDNLSKTNRFLAKTILKINEWFYNHLLFKGMLPQDAREFLPLCSYTKVVYTYNIKEWKHILDLRYRGITGKPHPNAFAVAEKIHNEINNFLKDNNFLK